MNTADLTVRQQSLIPIATFTACGDLEKLRPALVQGLDAGLTINDIKEVLVQLYAYLGFPRSLNAIATFMSVLDERKKGGISDEVGSEPNPLPTDKTRLELGTEIQTQLLGAPVKLPILDFAPAIDAYLKDHLFGDIFGRDNLNFQDREIATIGALAGLSGVEPQLMSHFKMSMNVGVTVEQLNNIITVLESKVGQTEAERAKTAFNKIQAK